MFGAAHAGRLMSPKHRGQAKRDLKVRQERLGDWEKEKEVRIKKLIAQGYRVSVCDQNLLMQLTLSWTFPSQPRSNSMTSMGASTAITDVSSVSEMASRLDDVSLTDSGYSGDPTSLASSGKTWDSHEAAKKGRRQFYPPSLLARISSIQAFNSKSRHDQPQAQSPSKSTESTQSISKSSPQLLVPESSSRGSNRRSSFH